MSVYPLSVNEKHLPILILAFTRAQAFSRRLDEIISGPVRDVFIHLDGPSTESEVLNQSKIVKELHRLESRGFRVRLRRQHKNLGCRDGPLAGITWFFGLNPAGVILEDDIHLHPRALEFLDRAVAEIGKDSILTASAWSAPPVRSSSIQLRTTPFVRTWAWATTSDIWSHFMDWFGNQQRLSGVKRNLFLNRQLSIYQLLTRRNHVRSTVAINDAWDYSFHYWHAMNGRQLRPSCQLAWNEGFEDLLSTHRPPRLLVYASLPDCFGAFDQDNFNWLPRAMRDRATKWESLHEYPTSIRSLARYWKLRLLE